MMLFGCWLTVRHKHFWQTLEDNLWLLGPRYISIELFHSICPNFCHRNFNLHVRIMLELQLSAKLEDTAKHNPKPRSHQAETSECDITSNKFACNQNIFVISNFK